jgi:hypothetical protein
VDKWGMARVGRAHTCGEPADQQGEFRALKVGNSSRGLAHEARTAEALHSAMLELCSSADALKNPEIAPPSCAEEMRSHLGSAARAKLAFLANCPGRGETG